MNDLRKDLNRQGFGDQTGALAAITADGTNTFTVDNLQYLRVGMVIDLVNKSTDAILNASGAITITAINTSTRVVTYSGSDLTAVPGTHVPVLNGNWKKEMNGLRNMIRSVRGMAAAAPVNYLKLMPATYVVLIVVVGYMLLTVTADLVNPIRLFQ